MGDGTPGATRVVKKASRRSRRVGQQGKLAGDLGEMDAGAARSGWRGRKGTLTCGPALVSGGRVRSVRGRPSGLSAGVRWAERSRPRGKERGAEPAEGERGRGLERVLREVWSRVGEKEKKGWAAGKSPGRLAWAAGLVERKRWAAEEFGLGLFSFLFFYFQTPIKLKPNEFKYEFEFTLALKQIKQCSSMNA